MAGRFLGLEEMLVFPFHRQTQPGTAPPPCLTCHCSKDPSCFSCARVEGVTPGTSTINEHPGQRQQSRGLLLLLGVLRDR